MTAILILLFVAWLAAVSFAAWVFCGICSINRRDDE